MIRVNLIFFSKIISNLYQFLYLEEQVKNHDASIEKRLKRESEVLDLQI